MKRNVVAWAALVVSTAALVSSRGFTPPVPAAPEIPAEGQKTAKSLSEAFEAVADFVRPSVVQISVQHKGGLGSNTIRRFNGPKGPMDRLDPKQFEDLLKKFFSPEGQPEQEQFSPGIPGHGTGSGFVYDDQGHILTNNHVVAGAQKIVVTFHDGVEAEATVVGTDPGTDVAVIKVDQKGYRAVHKGDSSKLRVGEWVLAIGSPFGLSQTVTAGIISGTERAPKINDYEAFIQTDASINPGNSGGPLVDMNGHVVGINSAIMTTTRANAGVGFAIPMDMASSTADKLIKDGKINRARLGITLPPLTPALAKQLGLDPKTKGIIVGEVVDGSPASKAGLKQGDIITSFDGTPVYNGASLRNIVATSDLGKSHTITLIREGHEQKVSVTLAPEEQVHFAFEQDSPKSRSTPEAAAPKAEVNDFGLSVQELKPELAAQFGYKKGTEGLVVTTVKEGSPAEAAGLEPGNLITKVIKDKKLQTVKSLKEFEDFAGKTDELALYVVSPEGPGAFVTLSKSK